MSWEEFVVPPCPPRAGRGSKDVIDTLIRLLKEAPSRGEDPSGFLPSLSSLVNTEHWERDGELNSILDFVLAPLGLTIPTMVTVYNVRARTVRHMLESGYRVFKAKFFDDLTDERRCPGIPPRFRDVVELPFQQQVREAGLSFAYNNNVDFLGWGRYKAPNVFPELCSVLQPLRRYVTPWNDTDYVLADVYIYTPTGKKVVFIPFFEYMHLLDKATIARAIATFLFIILPVFEAEGLLGLIRRVDGVASEAVQAARATLPALTRLHAENIRLQGELEVCKRDRPRLALFEVAKAVSLALPSWRYTEENGGFTLKLQKTIYPRYIIRDDVKYRIRAKNLYVKGLTIRYTSGSNVFEVTAEDAIHANISSGGSVCLGDLGAYTEATPANLIVLVHRLPKMLETCNLDSAYTALREGVHYEVLGLDEDEYRVDENVEFVDDAGGEW